MSATFYPTSAVWNWDLSTEGTHILLESGPGGPRVNNFTANATITAGQCLDFTPGGSVVGVAVDSSLLTIGIATEAFASGAHGPVCSDGFVRGVTASGAINPGQRVIAALTPAGSVKAGTTAGEVIGTAITTATTTGNTIVLYVHH